MSSRASRLAVTPTYAMFVVVGALVFTLLGAYWAVASLVNWPAAPVWAYALVAIPAAGLVALAVVRLVRSRALPPAVDPAQASHDGKRMGVAFGVIFTVEFALIALSAVLLDNAGRSLLIPVVVAFIVGVHFLPLARVFRLPFYYVTGVLCAACALASLLIGVEAVRLHVLGLAVAAVLWASALVVLLSHTGDLVSNEGIEQNATR
jgi:hypothetical protein